MRIHMGLAAAFCLFTTVAAMAAAVKVSSPDGRIEVSIDATPQLTWAVTFNGRPALLPSKLGLEFRDAPMLGADVRLGDSKVSDIKETWENPVGKRRLVTYEAKELRVRLEEQGGPKRIFDLVIRASNDGVALRYDLPAQEKLGQFVLTRDGTEFTFPRDGIAFAADHNGYKSPQESQYVKRRLSSLAAGRPYGMPLLCEVEPKLWVAIAESDLLDWAGMYIGGGTMRSDAGAAEIKAITGKEAPQALSVPLDGACELLIDVDPANDNRDGVAVDLAEARLVRANGTAIPLADLPAAVASPGWGMPFLNERPWGGPLAMRGKTYDSGIGVFSRCRLRYVLPPGEVFKSFETVAGIDDQGEGKGCVRIAVRAERPGQDPRQEEGPVTLKTLLSPRVDGQGLVVSTTPRKSPWRVLWIADHPGRMVESDLIQNLATPSRIGDAAWVRPGACAWDHWWSAEQKMDMPTNQQFIQFASDMGFAYQLVDWGWYGDAFNMNASITSEKTVIEMPKLVEFAKQKNVRLIAWVFWNLLDKHLEEALATYEKWGLAGIKVDFMDRDDQEMVNWYEKVTKACAEHHLLVNFHGAYKGTGLERTYPNQITREGILGNEYNKSSFRINPTHIATLPYTRLLVGPGDFTPGGFINRQPGKFHPQGPTQVMGTRARELALCVAFLSPMLCIADQPEMIQGKPGAEFLKNIPAAWDETRFIDGEVGEWIAIARRSGKSWYIGAVTAKPRTIEIPLGFLGEGSLSAEIYADGPKAADDATDLKIEKRPVTAKDVIKLKAAPAGGAAIVIR